MPRGRKPKWSKDTARLNNPMQASAVAIAKKEIAVSKARKSIKISKIPKLLFKSHEFIKMRYQYNRKMGTGGGPPTALMLYQDADATPNPYDLFNINSLAYPRYGSRYLSTSDTRPQGYDQADNAYAKYKVYGAKVTVKLSNPSADGAIVVMKVSPSDDTQRLAGITVDRACEKRGVFKPIPVNNTGSQVVTRSFYLKPNSIDGLSKGQFSNDINNYNADFGSNPSSIQKFELALASTTTTNVTLDYEIVIEYYVRLYRRQTLATSII